ncbi:MAG: BrnT family toxin [Bryobacteraceae bacterium]
MGFEWDAAKVKANFRNHGVRFEESTAVFDDPYAITIADDKADPSEERFVSIGMGALGRVLIVVYTYRGDSIRIISARVAVAHERAEYEAGLP